MTANRGPAADAAGALYGFLLFVAAVMGVNASALAEESLPPARASYSAEAVVQLGNDKVIQKVYHAAGLERQEMWVDGLMQVTILRPDLDRAFVIQPGLEDYLELPLEEATLLPSPRGLEGYQIEALGSGRDGGEAVVKYRLHSSAEQESFDLVVFITEDGIITRMEGEMIFEDHAERVLLLQRDIERAAQDPKLFEPEAAQSAMEQESRLDVPEIYNNIGKAAP